MRIKCMIPNIYHQRQDAIYFDIYLHAKNQLYPNVSFLIYCKDVTNLFGYSGYTWSHPSSRSVICSIILCRKLWCLFVSKKSTLSLTSSLRYSKGITNLLLWVLWAWLAKPTKNDNINLQETLFILCKTSAQSLTSWYFTLKESCNLIEQKHFGPYLKNLVFLDMGFLQENRKSTFFLDQIHEKKIFFITFKIPYFQKIWHGTLSRFRKN